mgnify:CR=1 FL=1
MAKIETSRPPNLPQSNGAPQRAGSVCSPIFDTFYQCGTIGLIYVSAARTSAPCTQSSARIFSRFQLSIPTVHNGA